MTTPEFDVVVVGAGPAATTYATAMASGGASVLMLGSIARDRTPTLELMSGRTLNALTRLGIGPAVRERFAPLAATVFRWGRGDFATRVPEPTAWGPGWIVDRGELDALLVTNATAKGVTAVDAIVASVVRDSDGWAVEYSTARAHSERVRVRARGVALASGRASKLGPRSGLARRVRHRMVAITTWLPAGALDLNGRMLVDSTDSGWWYAMGTTEGTTVGFVTDADLMNSGSDRARATWQFEAARCSWLPQLPDAGLHLRPAVVSETVVPAAPERELVPLALGDLAIAADPMSGHGLILALESGLRAASHPGDYWDWLERAQQTHAREEGALYAAEPRYSDAPFWSRRLTPDR